MSRAYATRVRVPPQVRKPSEWWDKKRKLYRLRDAVRQLNLPDPTPRQAKVASVHTGGNTKRKHKPGR